MFDEYLLDKFLVDYQVDWLTEQPCEDCGGALEMSGGGIVCPGCDIDYELQRETVYKREGVN